MDLVELPNLPIVRRHPWEIVRANFFIEFAINLIEQGMLTKASVLDVGSGDAWLMSEFKRKIPQITEAYCWDSNYKEEHLLLPHVVKYKLRLVKDQPEERFQLILLLDVLEHIEDDLQVLKNIIAKNLDEDGYLLISVPAWQSLYSSHDRNLLHFRRYSTSELQNIIAQAGLQVIASGGLFHSLLPLRLLQKAKELVLVRPTTSDLGSWNKGVVFSKLVENSLSIDAFFSKTAYKLNLKVPGLTCWAICKKD